MGYISRLRINSSWSLRLYLRHQGVQGQDSGTEHAQEGPAPENCSRIEKELSLKKVRHLTEWAESRELILYTRWGQRAAPEELPKTCGEDRVMLMTASIKEEDGPNGHACRL